MQQLRKGAVMLALIVLAGCAAEERSSRSETPAASGPQRYEIAVGTEGFEPAVVRASEGEELTLVFTRTTDKTCGTEVVIPSLGVNRPLPLHEPVEVKITPERSGEIVFGCGMNLMLSGKIVVE